MVLNPGVANGERKVVVRFAHSPVAAAAFASTYVSLVEPRTRMTWAPCTMIWASFATVVVSGTSTVAPTRARAAYALLDAPALPLDEEITRRKPSPQARVIMRASARSLNEPVGL